MRTVVRRLLGVVVPVGVALACVLAVVAPAAPASAAPSLPGEASTFLGSTLFWNWYASPAGANTGCVPSARHPYPVVLSEGTFGNMYNSFGALSPYLAGQGYCVYAFNYGQTIAPSMFDAMGNIAGSAAQLGSFVRRVLARTGAQKVDIVGWSQGGMMPRYYIDDLGGAPFVHELVALAPSNHGTTLDGIQQLVDSFGAAGVFTSLLSPWCEACVQQLQGSSFLDALNAGGGTEPDVHYVVIETRYDEVVTPYTNAFLSGPNVQDVLLQDQCPQDHSDHLSIPYDSNALQDVANALGPDDPSFVPSCASVGPLFGNV